jgi:membrane-bound ClpP family serine protease
LSLQLLTDRVSWRWCFYINLPTGGVAIALLVFFLKLNPHKRRSFRDHMSDFDFIGLFLMIGGVVCLLIGLNNGTTSWSSAETIALVTVGSVMLVSAGFYESITTRSPILPPRLFHTRTTAILLITSFFHAMAFFGAAYYLPMYFQVLGSSAIGAGVRMLPFSLGAALFSAIGGITITKTGSWRPVMWLAFATMTLGFGLMTQLSSTSTV